MILEVAHLDVIPEKTREFEHAFQQAAPWIAATDGYICHELRRCIETPQRYVLLVQWETLEAHTIGFRQSERYPEWKKLLHHFYDPFPLVEHYEPVFRFERENSQLKVTNG